MSRPTKYTEIKNCNKCKQNINNINFTKCYQKIKFRIY